MAKESEEIPSRGNTRWKVAGRPQVKKIIGSDHFPQFLKKRLRLEDAPINDDHLTGRDTTKCHVSVICLIAWVRIT